MLLFGINSNPSGISSFIKLAYPLISPSLYTRNVYVITSPVFTSIAFFGCVYVAVVDVPFTNGVISTCGALDGSTFTSLTSVMNFLKLKSTVGFTICVFIKL